MNPAEAEERAARWFGEHMPGRHQQPRPTFTPAASSASSQPEVPVSLLTEIENDIHNVAAKMSAVDKAAYEAIDAFKASPVAWSIFVTLASAAHVPDPGGILNAVDILLKALAGNAQQPQQQAPANGTGAHAAQPGTPQVI